MTPDERQTLHEAIKEALQNCPPWHRVIMGNNGKVYPVRHDPMPPKTYVESPNLATTEKEGVCKR